MTDGQHKNYLPLYSVYSARLLYISCLFSALLAHAQNTPLNYQWAKQAGGSWSETATATCVDSNGNVYITGRFKGFTNFPTAKDTIQLVSLFSNNIFIAKYDSQGSLLWANNIGGESDDDCYSVQADTSENLYVTGFFQSVADFDPGPDTATLSSSHPGPTVFLAKYDKSGNYGWAVKLQDTVLENTYAYSLSLNNGFIYVAGEGFLAQYTLDGENVWKDYFPMVQAKDVITDLNGNILIVGSYSGTADFDPGPQEALLSTFHFNAFLAKYNSLGQFLWVKEFSGSGNEWGKSVAIDLENNAIYIVGMFDGKADFDPSDGSAELVSQDERDVFVAKYTSEGDFIWAQRIGSTTLFDECLSIKTDRRGDIYLAGSFGDIGHFEFPNGEITVRSFGQGDIFVAKCDPAGKYLWLQQFGSRSNEVATSIAVDENSFVYLTGIFSDTIDFDPSMSVDNILAVGGLDIFTAKFGQKNLGISTQINRQDLVLEFLSTPPETGYKLCNAYDLMGRMFNLKVSNHLNRVCLHTDNLPKGCYYTIIVLNSDKHTIKFVKQE